VDLAVLVVNAGSTSTKLHLVEDDRSRRIDSLEAAHDVDLVAHRVVHGGQRFREPVLVDDQVLAQIHALEELAPLHNAAALRGLAEARQAFPGVRHAAVFDTGFHATMPPVAATYAIPRRWREEWGVRRYGFHGLSVQWAAEQVRVPRLVVCHLGGGCSVTAVRDGRSVDTTMGFSPLEGVPMATRSGSVDPGALVYLLRGRGLPLEELDRALESESGLLALAGRDMEEIAAADDEDARLALGVFCHRVACAVGAMSAAAGGLDALVFTGGIGENSQRVREEVCGRLAFLLERAQVHVVAAREELIAARAARALLAR
jgi:acetate kinase